MMPEVASELSRRQFGLQGVQTRRRAATLMSIAAAVSLLPLVHSVWADSSAMHEATEVVGIVLMVIAILGRSWCSLYIGGRKFREIVAVGPYSISRNPLYMFTFIGVLGIGAQTGSVVVAPLLLAVVGAIFLPVILREEAALAARFGPDYDAYCLRVPRFGPRFSSWIDPEIVEFRPKLLWKTLSEAFLLLLAIPLCEGVEWLQATGLLAPLLHLP